MNYEIIKGNNSKYVKLKDYLTNLQAIEQQYGTILSENVELQEELKSANESITWWTNRYSAIQQENKELKERLEYLESKVEHK